MTMNTTARAGMVTTQGFLRRARKMNESTTEITAMRQGPEKTESQSPAGI